MPEGLPAGWKGIEQAYGPTSKSAGKTYVRYSSLDGRHRSLLGPKQIVQAHCADLGIPWEDEQHEPASVVDDATTRVAEAWRRGH